MDDPARRLRITEVFYSLQGESTYAGRRCTFIRLTGCNLRCAWCDTTYSFQGGGWQTFEALLAQVEANGCPLVELTGGEPLLQKPVLPFMTELCDRGYTVLLETSGSLDVGVVDPRVIKIVDMKCPSSGESAKNLLKNLEILGPRDEVKFVVADQTDYLFARDLIRAYHLESRGGILPLISPVHGRVALPELARWILEDRLEARFQLQLHKFIWGAEATGV